MSKLLSAVLAASIFLLIPAERPHSVTAQTCAENCPPPPLQFIPGRRINFEVVNLTNSLVLLQKIYGTDPISLSPGQVVSFQRGGATDPNLSVLMWDATGLPLGLRVSKANSRTLRIEVRPGGRPPGDRTVYLRDDGRVAVF